MKKEILSLAGAIVLAGLLALALNYGIVAQSDLSSVIATFLVGGFFGTLAWGIGSAIKRWAEDKPDVIIQASSLRFNKYPYLLIYSDLTSQRMPNMIYGEITVENRGKAKAEECEVKITLKDVIKGEEAYESKVLSADSTRTPNPMTISIDALHGTVGFHPICLDLRTLTAFMPNNSLGRPGAFTGTLVKNGEYEILGKTIYNGRLSQPVSLGIISVPEDLLERAKFPNDIQVTIEQGGSAMTAELCEGKVRAKFFGQIDYRNTAKIIREDVEIREIDDKMIELNGKRLPFPRIFLFGPHYEAEIVNKKRIYKRGEAILFRAFYHGKLVNGFFDNEIRPSTSQPIPGGGSSYWSWDPETLDNSYPTTKGKLNGAIEKESRWHWTIPLDAPLGQYTVCMRVYNHLDVGNRPIIAELEETILVG